MSYGNTPFAQNICGNKSLTVMTKDSAGTVVSSLIQIPAQIQPKYYSINWETVSSVTDGNGITQSTYKLIINPPLPLGVTMNFDIVLTGRHCT